MLLYLVQHGLAKSGDEDPERSLTRPGVAGVESVAGWAAGAGVTVPKILHSGKRRAQQTAEIMARQLAAETPSQVSGLKPNDDVHEIANSLDYGSDAVMLVGHLPHLSRLASLLVTGDESVEIIRFRNAGIVCLESAEDGWLIAWAITPEQLAPGR